MNKLAVAHRAAELDRWADYQVEGNGGDTVMAEIPWNFRIQPDPSREYLVAATSGLRISWWNPRRAWAFQRYTLGIIEQLNQSAGCVGFSLRTTFRPFEGSTISVWEDIESLR